MNKTPAAAALIAAVVLAHAHAHAAPRWQFAAKYTPKSGGEATMYVDPSSIVKVGKLRRSWVMTDFSDMQIGAWTAPAGESKAYMSQMSLWLIDCSTKDVAVGALHLIDAAMGKGQTIRTENQDLEKQRREPMPPGSVGEGVALKVCAAKL